MVAVPPAPAPSDFVSVVAVQPAGRPVAVKSNESLPSPVFMTGKVTEPASPSVTFGTDACCSAYVSTRTPGPRTSKYTRIGLPASGIARTATLEAAPSLHVLDMVRCKLVRSLGSQASPFEPL